MNDTLQAVEYRRLVASIASHLSPEEVERILFIRREKLEALQVSGDEDTATALHTLAALERQGEFSLQNIDGLTEVAKDVNRHDLVRMIESYKKTRYSVKKPPKIRTPKLLRRSSGGSSAARSSRERTHLEETYEMMVTRFTFLEQQMSLIPRLLEGEGDIQDEGTVILTSLKCASEELATRLADAYEYFQELSGGEEGFRGSFEDLRRRNSDERKQDQLSREAEVIYAQPIVRAQPPEMIYDRPTHPPLPAQNSKQLLVRPPIAMVSRRSHLPESREGSGYARPGEGSGYTRPGEGSGYTKPDEDQDFTGDSGFSSSSKYFDDSDPYCVVDLWRRPPPNSLAPQKKAPASDNGHGYMSVCTASMNTDPVYDTVQTPPKPDPHQE